MNMMAHGTHTVDSAMLLPLLLLLLLLPLANLSLYRNTVYAVAVFTATYVCPMCIYMCMCVSMHTNTTRDSRPYVRLTYIRMCNSSRLILAYTYMCVNIAVCIYICIQMLLDTVLTTVKHCCDSCALRTKLCKSSCSGSVR
jgi:hypothetical protein